MAKIDLPFLQRFHEDLLAGKKIATCRSKKYGEIGDWFEVADGTFKLLAVVKTTLSVVSHHLHVEEGCNAPIEFEAVWNNIHRRKPYHPDTEVYLHIFRRVESKPL